MSLVVILLRFVPIQGLASTDMLNSAGLMKQTRKTSRPSILTVKRNAEAVLPDVPDRLDSVASIRRGLEQAKKGLGRPVNKVFDELARQPREKPA